MSDDAFSTDRPPALASRVHSLVPFLLFGASSPILPPSPFGAGCPAGASSLFAASTEGVHSTRELPGLSLRSALRLSQPLDGLLHLRLHGLISSRSHVQGCYSVQGFLPIRSRPDSSPGDASMPFHDHPLTGKPAATDDRLDFEALLCGAMRSSKRGLAASLVAPLYGFLPPPGSHASIVSRAHPVLRS
jgi:hypothetical protein